MIAGIASSAQGVVTRAELLDAGVTAKQIERRIRRGSLIREFPGTYRVGHRAPSVLARFSAAVKACGRGAVLCGLAAGYLHGLLRRASAAPRPEVMTSTERRVEGIKPRRSRRIDPRDVTTVRGIPVTTVARTLVDLAAVLDEAELARACHEAGVKYGTTPQQVAAVLERRRNAKGARKLRRVLTGDVKVSLSELERGFFTRLEAEDLPLPETNKVAGGRRVDCRWPQHKLTVELNGYRFHNSRHSWEQDYQREREARARGDEFRRYTYADVFEDWGYMMSALRKLLA